MFSALLGCLARLFTTAQEVNDPLVFWGFFGAAVLNVVLVIQMVRYWDKDDVAKFRMSDTGLNSPAPKLD